jgi:hypothetical protein
MVVRTIRTAPASAAGVEGMVKRKSAEALTGKPTSSALAATDPLTEALSVGGILGWSSWRATSAGEVEALTGGLR